MNMRKVLFISLLLGICVVSCSESSRGGSRFGGSSFSDDELSQYSRNWGEGNIPQAAVGSLFKDVHFAYDSSVVSANYIEVIREDAGVLKKDLSLHVEIEGHCDKRGTNEYNLALGEERARAVAAILTNYGVDPSQISTISYGEEIPLDPGNNEEAFAKNRRAHFALYRKRKDNKK